jgi:hypothetical protein
MYFRAGRFGALTALLLPVLVLAKASGLASADPKKKTELRVQRERESHGPIRGTKGVDRLGTHD